MGFFYEKVNECIHKYYMERKLDDNVKKNDNVAKNIHFFVNSDLLFTSVEGVLVETSPG